MLTHSFERYNGANRRTTLPKRCWVSFWERTEIGSKKSEAAGEMRQAKSASDNLLLSKLVRTAAGVAASERRTKFSGARELNSATKLTETI